MALKSPVSYQLASEAERVAKCNGCGTKGLGGWLVPDTLWGLDISEACNIHDWMYAEGSSQEDKEIADHTFLENLLTLAESGTWWLRSLRRYRAMSYYNAVSDWGDAAFWSGKEKDHA